MTFAIIAITVLISWIAFNRRDLFAKLQLNPYIIVHRKEWFRLLTHGFIHADWAHLIFNMFSLFFFGPYIEKRMPAEVFLIVYLGGIVVASISSVAKYKDKPWYNSVGASGGVSSIVFASILLNPLSSIYIFLIPIPVPGIVYGALFLWYSQYMSKKGHDNINHEAHFYGALFGFGFPLLYNFQYLPDFIYQIKSFF